AKTKTELEDHLTDLRQANEQLVVATVHAHEVTEAAEQAARLKEQFLPMLAHELRNPLAPIRNAVGILRRVQTAEPLIPWIYDVITRQVEHMARLLDDLLDVSRVTTGKIVLQRQPIALTEFVEQAIETSRPLIDGRRQRLQVSIPPQPICVDGDAMRLAQVISNLLNNAAKYTQEGGDIALSAEQCGDVVVLRVSDNGSGIAPAMLPRIFDLFAQSNRTLARAEGGLGIGLTVVHSMVEMHGGTVEARSAGLDQGSEFVVTLPVVHDVPPKAASPRAAEPPSSERSYRIVLIEDNVDANDTLRTLLQMIGHEVTSAFDGVTALSVVEASRPQIVLCDIGLPGMDGFAVIARLREQLQDAMPMMIALTGYGQVEDHRRALAAGFDYHLVKPIDVDALSRLIAAHEERASPASVKSNGGIAPI
nr:response regulator [Betaproteobacteria bacterium]